jgi:hypothetical protein
VCDGVWQLLLQRTPTEGSYQQSLFGKFLVWLLLILGTVAVQKNHQSNWTCSKEPVDGSEVCESSKSIQHQHMPFREAVEQDLKSKPCIQQLGIEIEPKLQSKSVDVNERQLIDH